jgi:hypothetical protein
MGVEEGDFHKPKDRWCPHALKKRGCACYETRPTKCRDFNCLWVTGQFGEAAHRPDKIHGVVTATTTGENWVIHEDPGYEGYARRVLKPAIDAWLDRGPSHYVIVVCGSKRSFNGDIRTFERLRAAGTSEVHGAYDVTGPVSR